MRRWKVKIEMHPDDGAASCQTYEVEAAGPDEAKCLAVYVAAGICPWYRQYEPVEWFDDQDPRWRTAA